MKTVLVTGASGFIGKNLYALLERDKDIKVIKFTRDSNHDDLEAYVLQADFIFHLAGVNRPKKDSEFDLHNRALTEKIVKYLEKAEKNTPVLFSSSTQAQLDNAYGQSKKEAENILQSWHKRSGNKIYIYRLPGVFGKWCKPNYNSVVATFCHNIVHDKEISISDPAKSLNLVYIDDVVEEFLKALAGEVNESKDNYYQVTPEFHVTLSELSTKLRYIKESRENLLVPNFEDVFDRNLYATFTSYFDQDDVGYPLDKKSDERGWLAEFIKSEQFGQIYISRTNPGFTRGIHWHNTKVEKFLVIEGEAELKLRQLHSDEVLAYHVSGDKLQVMEMPVGYVHSIKNVGKKDMFLLIWSQQVFSPEHPDTYYQEV